MGHKPLISIHLRLSPLPHISHDIIELAVSERIYRDRRGKMGKIDVGTLIIKYLFIYTTRFYHHPPLCLRWETIGHPLLSTFPAAKRFRFEGIYLYRPIIGHIDLVSE